MSFVARVGASFIVVASLAVAALAAQQRASTPSQTVDVQILAFNDFHGALEPPAGANGRIANTVSGGIEFLAAHLARLKATNPNTVIVSAGDNIGGTPLLSSLFHDEGSVEALNMAGLNLSAVGNHDLDEGWWELYRMVKGGCHPDDGCQDGTPYEGAKYAYLSANITLDPKKADPARLAAAGIKGTQRRTLFEPYAIKEFGGVRVGFIGLTLQGAPRIITPPSTAGLTFSPEPEAANEAAKQLRRRGVDAIVVLMHEGGVQRGANPDPDGCENISADIVGLVNRMSNDIDVVVSGHSHQAYNCTIGGKLVTSASSSGRVLTDIDLTLERRTGRLVSKAAHNIIVSRDVAPAAAESALIARYRPLAVKVGGRVVGAVAAAIPRAFNDAGESALGNVIADAMLEASQNTPGAGGDVAFMNSGGIRSDIAATAAAPSTAVTYAQLFEVLPFGNIVIAKTMTGDGLVRLLEEDHARVIVGPSRILQPSRGFAYTYDTSRPVGQRVDRASIRINGAPLVPAQKYRVVSIDFIWNGGDDFSTVKSATDPVTVGTDVDVLAAYLTKHSPVSPGPQNRVRKQP